MEEYNFYYNNLILIPAISLTLTVFLKALFVTIKEKKINISASLGSGGMPSVHTAVVVSIATAVLLKHGLESDFFATVVGFTIIIIYDAINVRYEAGLHASAINNLLGEKKFKESLGHLPSEAFVGCLVGIGVALGLYYM